MSPHIRCAFRNLAAAAIPVGMAAALACSAQAASAVPAAGAVPSASAAAAARSASGGAATVLSAARPRALAMHSDRDRDHELRRLRAFHWALTQKGHPYVYGGTGPGYDCSGLVMMAYRHAGIHLPRTTDEMLASRLLVRVRHPRKGDLAFYGTGHVELFVRWGYTYGAHDYGTVVSQIHYGYGWVPTAYYRVR
jgi:peptidoglycan DL-endopeptidase CwlO